MSTNKTQHYQLHSWAAEDKFLRSEMNENFTKLDEASRVIVGVYQGDGAETRTISLGFTPRAVVVADNEGQMGSTNYCRGGLTTPQMEVREGLLRVVTGGFEVHSQSAYISTNNRNYKYCYLAIR